MQRDEILGVMKTQPGWSVEQLAERTGMATHELEAQLEAMLETGETHRSPAGRWRAKGAVTAATSSGSGEWGKRTRMLIYSPQILAACPQFTRNTFLHFVEDEDHHFRLRDYVDGRRIEVKEVNGITLSKELAVAYPRFELEFDDEEEHTALTDNEFWERRIAAHNVAHAELLAKSDGIVRGDAGKRVPVASLPAAHSDYALHYNEGRVLNNS